MTAAGMALDGQLRGLTIEPPRSWVAPPSHSSLAISFAAEKTFGPPTNVTFLPVSPTPPAIIFGTTDTAPVQKFVLAGDAPVALSASRLNTVVLSPALLDEDGFGHLTVENTDGSITVPAGVKVTAPALGSVALTGANVAVGGQVFAPGGKLNFTTFNISPAFVAELLNG